MSKKKQSPEELFTEIGSGNQQAFKKLFHEFYPYLCAYVNSIINNKSITEDTVQEVFLELWEKRESLKISSSLRSYLFTAARNRAINSIRKNNMANRHMKAILEERKFMEIEDPPSDMERITEIRRAISRLPSKCREIFELSCYRNMKYREIADHLGISVNTVKTQIRIAYKKLGKELH